MRSLNIYDFYKNREMFVLSFAHRDTSYEIYCRFEEREDVSLAHAGSWAQKRDRALTPHDKTRHLPRPATTRSRFSCLRLRWNWKLFLSRPLILPTTIEGLGFSFLDSSLFAIYLLTDLWGSHASLFLSASIRGTPHLGDSLNIWWSLVGQQEHVFCLKHAANHV